MSGTEPVRPECVHAFQDIAVTLAAFEGKQDGIAEDVAATRKAVVGNGDTSGSLVARASGHAMALKILGASLGIVAAGVISLVVLMLAG